MQRRLCCHHRNLSYTCTLKDIGRSARGVNCTTPYGTRTEARGIFYQMVLIYREVLSFSFANCQNLSKNLLFETSRMITWARDCRALSNCTSKNATADFFQFAIPDHADKHSLSKNRDCTIIWAASIEMGKEVTCWQGNYLQTKNLKAKIHISVLFMASNYAYAARRKNQSQDPSHFCTTVLAAPGP